MNENVTRLKSYPKFQEIKNKLEQCRLKESSEEKIIKIISKLIGVNLVLDDAFPGMHTYRGEKYFNIMIDGRVSESQIYDKLIRISGKYGIVKRAEPNGANRIAIFLN